MPAPSSSLATLRPDLAQSLTEFDLAMNMQGFVGQQVCPILDVAKASGNFGRIPIEQLLQNPDVTRAPGSGYARGKFTFKPDTYITNEYGFEETVDDNEAEMYADYFDAEQVCALRAHHAVLLGYELRVVNLLTNSTDWTGAQTTPITIPWDTVATATPITDVEAAIQAVFLASGRWPNALVLSMIDFRNLRNCAQIIDRVKYNGRMDVRPGDITTSDIAQCLAIEKVVVAGSAYNTANDGQAAALGTIWPKGTAQVMSIARSNDVREPCVARTFHWSGSGSTINGTVETYRDERVRGDVVRSRHQTGEKLMYKVAGMRLTGLHT